MPFVSNVDKAKRLVLASNNAGKLAELQTLLSPLGLDLIAQNTLAIGQAEEPHCTLVENALAKARFASLHTHLPAIADDAGLCIEAWGGKPGVDTAHYAARLGYAPEQANQVLLEALRKDGLLRADQRRASMVCVLVALRHAQDPEPLIAVGRVGGAIAQEPIGEYGFGFDPIFVLESAGLTFAQLPRAEKNRLSHRGLAAAQMVHLMQTQKFLWAD